MQVLVSKEQKVTGRRQTWGVRQRRAGVSATVWDPLPGARTYFNAAYARQVAEELVGPIDWTRSTGRGSANYYGETRA